MALSETIRVRFSHPEESRTYVHGFIHLWAVYVSGFNHREHCQKAFRGKLSQLVRTNETRLDQQFIFDEVDRYNSLYICGVAGGPVQSRKDNNLHLALEYRPGCTSIYHTYNGYLICVQNAVRLMIPELPDHWNGLPQTYTRCCNFRFCVYRFGYPGLENALQSSRPRDSIGECGQARLVS